MTDRMKIAEIAEAVREIAMALLKENPDTDADDVIVVLRERYPVSHRTKSKPLSSWWMGGITKPSAATNASLASRRRHVCRGAGSGEPACGTFAMRRRWRERLFVGLDRRSRSQGMTTRLMIHSRPKARKK